MQRSTSPLEKLHASASLASRLQRQRRHGARRSARRPRLLRRATGPGLNGRAFRCPRSRRPPTRPGRFFRVTRRKILALYFAPKPDSLFTAASAARTDAHSWVDDSRRRLMWARHVAEGLPNHETPWIAIRTLHSAQRKSAVYRERARGRKKILRAQDPPDDYRRLTTGR